MPSEHKNNSKDDEELLVSDLTNFGIFDFGYIDITSALPISYDNYEQWLARGLNANLSYLSGERGAIRADLKFYWEKCNSALVFLFPYPHHTYKKKQIPIADFALYGADLEDDHSCRDYHLSIPAKLQALLEQSEFFSEIFKDKSLEYKIVIDSAPILERDLAYRAGLGWFGKNSMLINSQLGSYFLIGTILLSKKINLPTKQIAQDRCGNCKKCIEACPTQAILPAQKIINANKCISCYTLEEFKEFPPPDGYSKDSEFGNYFFGCDICQKVCPWNKKIINSPINIKKDALLQSFLDQDKDQIIRELSALSSRQYKKKYKQTSFERIGKIGMLKNIKYWRSIAFDDLK